MNSEMLSQSNNCLRPLSSQSLSNEWFSKSLALALILLTGIFLAVGSPCHAQDGGDALFIDEKGNVGIGTAHPEKKLHVSGTIKALGFEGDGVVPKGVIVMWSGEVDEIPDGWALCDGSNGTPDLRSRFIVGADSREGGNYMPHASGDPDKLPDISVDTNREGDHQHKFPANYYARNFLCGGGFIGSKYCTGIDTRGAYRKDQPTQGAGNHSHTVAINFNEANSGENRPRWFALCFIIKR